MSHRFSNAVGLGFCFRNEKQRKWYIELFNGKMTPLIKRFDSITSKTVTVYSILGNNLGIMSTDTMKMVANGIRLRNVRAHAPDEVGKWMTPCYAEVARLEHKVINVALVDREWYVSDKFMHYDEYKFVARCLYEHAMVGAEIDEDKLRDSLVTALIASGMNEDFVSAIATELKSVDADGIYTLADFEIACNDNSI